MWVNRAEKRDTCVRLEGVLVWTGGYQVAEVNTLNYLQFSEMQISLPVWPAHAEIVLKKMHKSCWKVLCGLYVFMSFTSIWHNKYKNIVALLFVNQIIVMLSNWSEMVHKLLANISMFTLSMWTYELVIQLGTKYFCLAIPVINYFKAPLFTSVC